MEWVLVIHIFAGMWADSDSLSITSVPMASEEACIKAGEALQPLVSSTKKEVRYVCVRNK